MEAAFSTGERWQTKKFLTRRNALVQEYRLHPTKGEQQIARWFSNKTAASKRGGEAVAGDRGNVAVT
eukprot:4087350-Pyramimonas_sp.AAC.1